MRSILDAQAEWQLLRDVHPFLSQALSSASLDELNLPALKPSEKFDTQNVLTVGQFDVKALRFILQQVQLEQLLHEDEFRSFVSALNSLLELFERFIPEYAGGKRGIIETYGVSDSKVLRR